MMTRPWRVVEVSFFPQCYVHLSTHAMRLSYYVHDTLADSYGSRRVDYYWQPEVSYYPRAKGMKAKTHKRIVWNETAYGVEERPQSFDA